MSDTPLDHLRFHETETSRRIRALVRTVERDNASFGVLSTGEQCAVALVLNRLDLAKDYGTMLECAVRVGPEWLAAALYVQNNGWTDDERLSALAYESEHG
jgi:hypothetical protein